jgi:hypothetical protein
LQRGAPPDKPFYDKINQTNMTTTIAPPPKRAILAADLFSPSDTSHLLIRRFKKHHRPVKKPQPPKIKPAKAKLPNGRYFHKVIRGGLKKYVARMKRENEEEKKLRGARKKEAARIEKLLYPKGRAMYSMPAPKHRQIVCSKDIQNLMHIDPRPASRYLTKIRKKIGKKRGGWITLTEFCDNTPFTKEDVIPYLM